jgi:RimJ/RimL family protein N-acetyltransferase
MPEPVSLRRATSGDAGLLRAIRNDPDVRLNSWNTETVAADEHAEWLSRTLRDPERRLYIVVASEHDVGQVRLDRRTAQEAELSVDLLRASRGRGLGREAIRLGREAAHELGVTTVIAEIKPENVASQAAFASAGFTESARSDARVEMRAPVH